MKLVFAIACCAWLSGCASGGFGEPPRIDPMAGDGQTYVPGLGGGAELPRAEERITSTCTMKGQTVVCH